MQAFSFFHTISSKTFYLNVNKSQDIMEKSMQDQPP